jgi:hypothetical protein
MKMPLYGLALAVVTALALFFSCASSGNQAIGGFLSLDMAMNAVASEIEANIKPGSEIAVYQITASRDETGEYLVDFLNGKLTERKKLIPLAREKVLEAAAAEHQFQMSGLVSDASAVGIGHYLGAKAVINGAFEQYADFSQLRVRAIDVLTSMVLTSYTVRINNNDPVLKNITALRQGGR